MFNSSSTISASSLKLLTEMQAAIAAQVDKRTIRRLIKSGRLRAVDYGSGKRHHFRIHPDDLADVRPIETPIVPARVPRHRAARARFSSSVSSYLPNV